MTPQKLGPAIAVAALCLAVAAPQGASAEAVEVDAVLAPSEQIRLDFEDGSGRLVLFVRSEGRAEGSGPFAGATVSEYGMHDTSSGGTGSPRGYLVFARDDGSTAYVRWQGRIVSMPAADGGGSRLLGHGFWEVVGGTGDLAGLEGAGTLHIHPPTGTGRRFVLSGELVATDQ